MNQNQQPNFSKLRAALWPIHGYELKKFLPMGMMMFCALFNYTIVRDIKDALVVKAAGAETISFIKFWVVLPLAVLFVMAYTKASNKLTENSPKFQTHQMNVIIVFIFSYYLFFLIVCLRLITNVKFYRLFLSSCIQIDCQSRF